MKIYTKTGDDGSTGLLYGGRIGKDDPRADVYGTVDEANSALGLARAMGPSAEGLDALILELQKQLFVVGAEIATDPSNSEKLTPGKTKVTDEMVGALEARIDELVGRSPLPERFVVPGSTSVSACLDLSRSVVRRAERGAVALMRAGQLEDVVVRYLNRLSDLIFAAARYEESARAVEAPDPWQ